MKDSLLSTTRHTFLVMSAVLLSLFTLLDGLLSWGDMARSCAPLLFRIPGWRGGALLLCLTCALTLLVTVSPLARRSAIRRRCVQALSLHAALAALDAVWFFLGLALGDYRSSWWFPSSLLLSLWLLLCTFAARSSRPPDAPSKDRLWAQGLVTSALVLLALPLGALFQLHAYGFTDYRRRADAIVVLGARTYPNGRLSDALRDRMDTGIELFRQGYAPRLILSGGTVSIGMSEPAAMRKYAIKAGVPDTRITLDETGQNTLASVIAVRQLAVQEHLGSVLIVSQYFHLTRVKLLADRLGLHCYTVPATREGLPLLKTPYFLARELLGLPYYFLTT